VAEPTSGLPDVVHRFLYRNIDSVEQLEVLLLLRDSPGRGWTAEEVARHLYSHPSSILHRMSSLAGRGLLRELEPACYQYAPHSVELHDAVSRSAECYRERRVAVITLIASKPIENVRAFSDAFRIRRSKED
jgi:hypothetical protein